VRAKRAQLAFKERCGFGDLVEVGHFLYRRCALDILQARSRAGMILNERMERKATRMRGG
jgi:hypothetical protein